MATLREPGRIWPANWPAARVFLACHWDRQVVAGMSSAITVFHGIPTSEIVAACMGLRIPRGQWPDVAWGVRLMAAAARPVLNAAAAASAKS